MPIHPQEVRLRARRARAWLPLSLSLAAALAAGSARAQDTVPRPPQLPQAPAPAPAPPPSLLPPLDTAPRLSISEPAAFDADSAAIARIWGVTGLRIFGRDLFTRATSQFQAVNAGPVDPSYRLGPGDQILLVLTGDVDVSQTLEVSREGTITVPQVGQLVVQGLTLGQAEDLLFSRLSTVFAGVGRGPGATTQFNASLGRLRSNQVFLAGEVQRPGAYQVSSVGTAFTALYQARGPNVNGTFRRIEVRRAGTLLETLDVYDYLLRGDTRRDVRLDQGDIVFVPLAGRQVGVSGGVRRPAIYELLPGEELRDLLRFAGGLEATAFLGRVQIDRVLPPEQRTRGVDRVLIDVDLRDLARGVSIPLQDRDLIQVFNVSTLRRNRLVVDGEVIRPGIYEYTPGMSLWQLLDRAEGLTASAYTPRAHVYRLNPQDGTRTLISTPLLADSARRRIGDMTLVEGDSVVVYSLARLRNERMVRISGFVKLPGAYTLAEGMTVRDLILAAQGLTVGADPSGVELVRQRDPAVRTDTLATLRTVNLGTAGNAGRASPLESPLWIPSNREYMLQEGDEVIVRRAPGYEPPRRVVVAGEVLSPGPYPLPTRTTRLLDVIRAAGGPTSEADLAGLRVVRGGLPVGTNYAQAVRRPRGQYNLVLQAGDSVVFPARDNTVQVIGAVNFQARVLYHAGRSVADYVAEAGGYTPQADRKRVSITYANGERTTLRRSGRRRAPEVTPGSTITVPAKAETGEKTDWGEVVTRAASILGSLVTLFVVIDRLRN